MAFPWPLSIDFGTSNTTAAHTNPVSGQVEVASISYDRLTMGSHVFVAADGSCVVGDEAWNLAEADPAGLVRTPKRLVMEESVRVRGEEVPVARIVSAVVGEVIRKVSAAHDGEAPQEVMVTHPERWSEKEIDTLREAVVLAGVDRGAVFTLSEAVAAAYYYTRANRLSVGDRIGVFDFGGGTLDVAVLRFAGGGDFSVEAHDGDPALGGRSFDDAVREWVFEQLEDDDPDLLDYLRSEASESELIDLSRQIEKAKELLSDVSSAVIMIQTRRGSHPVQITREDFSGVIAPYVDRAVGLVKRVLHSARVFSAGDLRALYLTGGSSRVPVVQEALKELGTVRLDNPKTVVALGGLNYLIDEKEGTKRDVESVTQAPTGVGTSSQYMTAENQVWPEADVESRRGVMEKPREAIKLPEGGRAEKSGSAGARSIIGVLIVLVLIAVIAFGYSIFLNRNEGEVASNSSSVSSSSAPSPSMTAQTTTSNSSSSPSYDEMVKAALPEKLESKADQASCLNGSTIAGVTYKGGFVSCEITSFISDIVEPGSSGHITVVAAYDHEYAKGLYDDYAGRMSAGSDSSLAFSYSQDGKCIILKAGDGTTFGRQTVCPNSGLIRMELGFKDEAAFNAYESAYAPNDVDLKSSLH